MPLTRGISAGSLLTGRHDTNSGRELGLRSSRSKSRGKHSGARDLATRYGTSSSPPSLLTSPPAISPPFPNHPSRSQLIPLSPIFIFLLEQFFSCPCFFFFFRTSLLVASSTFYLIFTLFHPFSLVLLLYISFPLYYSIFLIYLFLLFFYLFSRTKIPPGVIACLCHISVPFYPFY